MDDRRERLAARQERLLEELARVEVELSREEGAIVGIPHYSVIESRAHQLGRRLSCEVQQQQMREMASEAPPRARCPTCGTTCELKPDKRQIKSIDGSLDAQELKGHCPTCRRDFFPSSGDIGA
jgi:hypothetical protein